MTMDAPTPESDAPSDPLPVPDTEPDAEPPLAPFADRMRRFTPRAWVTPTLIGLNGAVFIAMVATGVSFFSPTVPDLLRWGADYAPSVTAGQWWRLLTSTFLHIGLLHLAMNMYVLWIIGPFIERLVGNATYLAIYLVLGLAGSVASIAWNPAIVSAGASGAIFGLYGFLLGFLLRNHGSIPGDELKKLQRSALTFVGYNLLFGAAAKGIDMAAHLGGLAAGIVLGFAIGQPLTEAGIARRTKAALAGCAAGLAILAAGAWSLPRSVDLQAELSRFGAMETRVLDRFNAAVKQSRDQGLSDSDLAAILESEIIPPWREGRIRFQTLEGVPRTQAKLVADLGRYMLAREDSWIIMDLALRSQDKALAAQARQKEAEAERLLQALGGK